MIHYPTTKTIPLGAKNYVYLNGNPPFHGPPRSSHVATKSASTVGSVPLVTRITRHAARRGRPRKGGLT